MFFFEETFEIKYAEREPKEAYQWAIRVQNLLMNSMSVIAVTSTNEDSASEVFETLNDRGIGLSTPDLVRNLVLRRAPQNVREDIVGLWGEVIGFENDTQIKAFLRHFWISRYGDVKTQRLYREIKSHIVQEDVESLEFSRDVRDASNRYRDILAGNHINDDIENILEDLSSLGAGASILYPFFLSALETIEVDRQLEVLERVINLYVRHSIISKLENSKLENVVYRLAKEMREGLSVDDLMAQLRVSGPDDDFVCENFKRLSITQNSVRNYILRQIEMTLRGTSELKIQSGKKVHVEHIYPQTPEEGERLAEHAQVLNRIGNLTLLDFRLNASIKNGSFEKKRPAYEKSELIITQSLLKFETWNGDAIQTRQDELAEMSPRVWPVA